MKRMDNKHSLERKRTSQHRISVIIILWIVSFAAMLLYSAATNTQPSPYWQVLFGVFAILLGTQLVVFHRSFSDLLRGLRSLPAEWGPPYNTALFGMFWITLGIGFIIAGVR